MMQTSVAAQVQRFGSFLFGVRAPCEVWKCTENMNLPPREACPCGAPLNMTA